MGLLERLFGRRRRESGDNWARRDDSSQYVYDASGRLREASADTPYAEHFLAGEA